jgi:5-methylcytosine-specific restriction endonuclease McrA
MSRSKYTKDILEPIVKECTSIRQVLQKLGLKETGGNYSNIGKRIDQHGIDRSHFVGQGHMKGKRALNRRPTQYYLENKSYIHSSALRIRLIKEGHFEHKCQGCGGREWRGREIPLELHHIDCDHSNNSLDNLMLLCPNCHKFEHDNMKKLRRAKQYPIRNCKDCNTPISSQAKRCKSCTSKMQPNKIEWPNIDVLQQMVQDSNFSAVGRQLGVSDNSVRKRIRNHS